MKFHEQKRLPWTRTTRQANHAPPPSEWGIRVGAAFIIKQGFWRRGGRRALLGKLRSWDASWDWRGFRNGRKVVIRVPSDRKGRTDRPGRRTLTYPLASIAPKMMKRPEKNSVDLDRPRGLEAPFYHYEGEQRRMVTGWEAKADEHSIRARERKHAYSSEALIEALNAAGSLVIAAEPLFKADTIFGCVTAVACTLLYWHFSYGSSVNMSWNVVSVGIIFPLTQV